MKAAPITGDLRCTMSEVEGSSSQESSKDDVGVVEVSVHKRGKADKKIKATGPDRNFSYAYITSSKITHNNVEISYVHECNYTYCLKGGSFKKERLGDDGILDRLFVSHAKERNHER